MRTGIEKRRGARVGEVLVDEILIRVQPCASGHPAARADDKRSDARRCRRMTAAAVWEMQVGSGSEREGGAERQQ